MEVPVPVKDDQGNTQIVMTKSDVDVDLLQKIAAETNGKFYRATDTDSLQNIYAQINGLEKSTETLHRYEKAQDIFSFALIPALAASVGDRSRMHRRPHANALAPILDPEVGIILVPGGAFAVTARLEKNLVELPDDRVADQLANGADHLVGKTERTEKRALRRERTELIIQCRGRLGLAVPGPGNIIEQAFVL